MSKHTLNINDYDVELKKEVINLIIQFMTEMNRWELSCLEELENTAEKVTIQTRKRKKFSARLEKIYEKYCTAKKRKYTHQGSYGKPPWYDPDKEKILEVRMVNTNRMEITSLKEDGVKLYYKYIVLRRNQKWLIDNRKRLDWDGVWRKSVL